MKIILMKCEKIPSNPVVSYPWATVTCCHKVIQNCTPNCCTDDIWKTSFQSYDMQVTSNTPAAGTFKPLQSILKQIVPMSGYL